MLVLTCLSFSACNAEYTITKIRQDSYTLKAFRRQGGGGFLKAERSGEDGPFNVSFTGKSTGPGTGTEFLFELYRNGSSSSNSSSFSSYFYTIHPADWPEYMLAIAEGGLVAKKAHNSTAELTDKNYQFLTRDHQFVHADDEEPEVDVIDELTVIVSKANGHAIKSAKGGRVLWSSNWRDCGTWIYFGQ